MDPWDSLVPVSLGLRGVMGSKDRLDFQEPEGCRVKKGLRARRASPGSAPVPREETLSSPACRVLRDFGWAAPGSRARRVPQVFPDHQAPLECLGCREYLETTVCQDSPGSLRSWDPYPLSSTSCRASVGTVPRGRRPAQRPSCRKARRETRASPACQALTTVPGASQSGSAPERRRPGETTAREIRAVLGALACPVLRGCRAREEKRVHLA